MNIEHCSDGPTSKLLNKSCLNSLTACAELTVGRGALVSGDRVRP
ncbi:MULTISPECIES: hypothetical protein [unclassified Streptomyces]|nr:MULTISPECIES: hypothetical protein [unclassified Streptomyces]